MIFGPEGRRKSPISCPLRLQRYERISVAAAGVLIGEFGLSWAPADRYLICRCPCNRLDQGRRAQQSLAASLYPSPRRDYNQPCVRFLFFSSQPAAFPQPTPFWGSEDAPPLEGAR